MGNSAGLTHRLPPRATIVPALPRSVFFQNHRDSELIQSFNGDFRFCYREEDDLGDFFATELDDRDAGIAVTVTKKWTPIAKFVGFDVEIRYNTRSVVS
jgi:hypothetical protein